MFDAHVFWLRLSDLWKVTGRSGMPRVGDDFRYDGWICRVELIDHGTTRCRRMKVDRRRRAR